MFVLGSRRNTYRWGSEGGGGDYKQIPKEYIFSNTIRCVFDFSCSIVPLILLIVDSSGNMTIPFVLRITRFFKMGRLGVYISGPRRRGNRLAKRATICTPIVIQVCTGILQILFCAHIFACIWYYVGNATYGWTINRGLHLVELPSDDSYFNQMNGIWLQYWTSMYWAVTTLTTVGYGDISATNEEEILVCIGALLVGVMLYAYLIGKVSDKMQNLATKRQHTYYSHHQNALTDFDEITDLPDEIYEKVYEDYLRQVEDSYYESQLDIRNKFVNDLTNEGLKTIVLKEINKEYIGFCPVFSSLLDLIEDETEKHKLLWIVQTLSFKIEEHNDNKDDIFGEDRIFIIVQGELVAELNEGPTRSNSGTRKQHRQDVLRIEKGKLVNVVDCLHSDFFWRQKGYSLYVGNNEPCHIATIEYEIFLDLYFDVLKNSPDAQVELHKFDPVFVKVAQLKHADISEIRERDDVENGLRKRQIARLKIQEEEEENLNTFSMLGGIGVDLTEEEEEEGKSAAGIPNDGLQHSSASHLTEKIGDLYKRMGDHEASMLQLREEMQGVQSKLTSMTDLMNGISKQIGSLILPLPTIKPSTKQFKQQTTKTDQTREEEEK